MKKHHGKHGYKYIIKKIKKMKILITGNLGYIGSRLVKYFKETYQDSYIVGYDAAYFAHCITSNGPIPEVYVDEQFYGDVRSFPEHILEGVDVVVNLAAISNDPMGDKFELITNEINYISAIKIAKYSIKHNVKNYVYASSCSIYGAAEGSAKTENDTLNPLTAYAKSKSNSEIALSELKNHKMIITALRFSTACGMSERLRLDLVLNDFVASAVINKKIEILSDGSPWRPLINILDMCRAIDWASYRTAYNGSNFLKINIGSNSWNYQVKDLANAVSKIVPDVKIEVNKNALPDKRSYKVDFTLFSLLAPDYLPIVTLDDTIKELKEGIEKFVDNKLDFRSSNLIRFNVLNNYINNSLYDDKMVRIIL